MKRLMQICEAPGVAFRVYSDGSVEMQPPPMPKARLREAHWVDLAGGEHEDLVRRWYGISFEWERGQHLVDQSCWRPAPSPGFSLYGIITYCDWATPSDIIKAMNGVREIELLQDGKPADLENILAPEGKIHMLGGQFERRHSRYYISPPITRVQHVGKQDLM